MSLRVASSISVLTLVLATACGEHAPASTAGPGIALVSQAPAAPAASATVAASVEPPDSLDAPWLWATAEGTLLVIERSRVMAFDGTRWARHVAPPETEIAFESGWGSPHQLLVAGNRHGYTSRYDELTALSPVDLSTLHHGPGRVVDAAIAVPMERSRDAKGSDPIDDAGLVFVLAGKLVSLTLPAAGGKKEIVDLYVDPKADLAIVSWHDGARGDAAAFSLRGTLLGSAITLDEPTSMPIATTTGRLQYYIAIAPPPARPTVRSSNGSSSSDFSSIPVPSALYSVSATPVPAVDYDDMQKRRSLVVRDLDTGRVLRQRPIACGGFLGNPTVSPNRDTVVVTCENTALVLDGRTLTERRRIPYVIPGCDNAYALSGTIVSDAPATLKVEGCGGFAKLNLVTGRYLCGDSAGVMGGAYEPMDFGTHSTRPKRQAPPCSEPGTLMGERLSLSDRYDYVIESNVVVSKGNPDIQLEPESSSPMVFGNDRWLAYVHENKLVMRTLPSGAPFTAR